MNKRWIALLIALLGVGLWMSTPARLEYDPAAELPPIMAPVRPSDEVGARCYPRTPELYCGYGRGRYGNDDKIGPDETRQYNDDGTAGRVRTALKAEGQHRD